ncbi:MAG: hypothetical protein QM820_23885 [Minicystis sp.]
MSSARRVANPVAVRRFSVVGGAGREVVLTIGKPRRDPRPGGDWVCTVLIEGIPNERRWRAPGVDAVQALQIALEDARRELDASGLPLTWLDEGEPGDLGLPLSAPTGFGLSFQQRVERYIERQLREMAGALTAVLREGARRRADRAKSKE